MNRRFHSEEAMKASRMIARSRAKVELGHIICGHLISMLEERVPATRNRESAEPGRRATRDIEAPRSARRVARSGSRLIQARKVSERMIRSGTRDERNVSAGQYSLSF